MRPFANMEPAELLAEVLALGPGVTAGTYEASIRDEFDLRVLESVSARIHFDQLVQLVFDTRLRDARDRASVYRELTRLIRSNLLKRRRHEYFGPGADAPKFIAAHNGSI